VTDTKKPTTTERTERRIVLPVDPSRRTEIDKQRVPMSARPYRLLAMVKQDAVVRVQKEPDDTVMAWPHLLSIEFFAATIISIFLLLGGVVVGPDTLLRWYVLHVLALPFVLVIFLSIHFWRIRKDGGISGPL